MQPKMAKKSYYREQEREQLRFWLSVLEVHNSIFTRLNRELSAKSGISLAKFDTMAHLYRFPNGISMSDLSKALRVTNGNVSGLVNRLIREGLVQKEMSQDDRRSFYAQLTEAGNAKFEQALEIHKGVLSEMVSRIDQKEIISVGLSLRVIAKELESDA